MSTLEDEECLLLQLVRKRKCLSRMALSLLLRRRRLMGIKRKHRFWVHDIIKRRPQQGSYGNLVRELECDREKFREFFRMSAEKLEFVLAFVGPIISKQTRIREPISAKQRLCISIRFLATGESYVSLATQYRVGVSTVSKIVPEVCAAICQTMQQEFLSMPQTSDQWLAIAANFEQTWNYPHCIGCIDGKHVLMRAPSNSGSLFYNYKGTFSVVLMAVVDASYKFIYVDIGAYGKQSDAGIFAHSQLGTSILHPNSLHLPPDAVIKGAGQLGHMPYVLLGDEAFHLQNHIMRPYPGRNSTESQQAYNYRHSRARRIVECAFGILAARWRVYHTKLAVLPETVNVIIQATTILHNMLQINSTPASIVEQLEGCHSEGAEGLEGLRPLGTRGTVEASNFRNLFKDYFVANPLPWQSEYIRRGLRD